MLPKILLPLLLIGVLGSFLPTSFSTSTKLNKDNNNPLVARTINWKGVPYFVITVAPEQVQFFLEDAQQQKFKSFEKLKSHLEQQDKTLLLAMNGGMYLPQQDNEPQGLYIAQGVVRTALERETKIRPIKTNFYLHPNGVFYIQKDGKAFVKSNEAFQKGEEPTNYAHINYATQSGPMLVMDNVLHPAFTPNSKNVHFRNAVGILPNGQVCLVLSKEKVCFYDLATLFKEELDCANALYLDGYVSKLYYPAEKEYQDEKKGNFGVIIGVTQEQ